MANCPTCYGTGVRGIERPTCTYCGGTGGNPLAREYDFGRNAVCPRCHGRGHLEVRFPCVTCHGFGKLERARSAPARSHPRAD